MRSFFPGAIFVLAVWACVAQAVYAQHVPSLDLFPARTQLQQGWPGFERKAQSQSATTTPPYEAPLFTANTSHQYMGIGAVIFGVLAGLSGGGTATEEESGEDPINSTHGQLALVSAVLASGAVLSGYLIHGDDYYLSDGPGDPDNLHIFLGSLGALSLISAVSIAPDGTHTALGIFGVGAMATSIYITW